MASSQSSVPGIVPVGSLTPPGARKFFSSIFPGSVGRCLCQCLYLGQRWKARAWMHITDGVDHVCLVTGPLDLQHYDVLAAEVGSSRPLFQPPRHIDAVLNSTCARIHHGITQCPIIMPLTHSKPTTTVTTCLDRSTSSLNATTTLPPP